MKTIFRTFLFIFFLLVFSAGAGKVYAVSEEIEGKAIWEKLQAKQLECKNLTDDDFELLGEYFMGQTAGDSHESMNKMMEQMMGKDGEDQMHVAMGKRLSGCNSMMGYGWNNMMDGWGGFGLGWMFMILFWALLILGVAALIRNLARSGDNKQGKTPKDLS